MRSMRMLLCSSVFALIFSSVAAQAMFEVYSPNDYTEEGLAELRDKLKTLRANNKYLAENIYQDTQNYQKLLDSYSDFDKGFNEEKQLVHRILRVKNFLDDQNRYDVNAPGRFLFIGGASDDLPDLDSDSE